VPAAGQGQGAGDAPQQGMAEVQRVLREEHAVVPAAGQGQGAGDAPQQGVAMAAQMELVAEAVRGNDLAEAAVQEQVGAAVREGMAAEIAMAEDQAVAADQGTGTCDVHLFYLLEPCTCTRKVLCICTLYS
jgi:hypothetical protein